MGLIAIILGLAVLAAIAIFALRRAKPNPAGTQRGATRHAHAPSAVKTAKADVSMGRMLQCCGDACTVARELATTWFAEADAPKLPLTGCSHAAQCQCRWLRVSERRKEHRRAVPDRRGKLRFGDAPDRRSGGDRRKDRDTWRGHM